MDKRVRETITHISIYNIITSISLERVDNFFFKYNPIVCHKSKPNNCEDEVLLDF